MKKILLTESEKKAIISEREQAIINNFAKTFNSIKRIDENELKEERPISARYGEDPTPEQSAGIDKFVKDFLDKKDKEKETNIKSNTNPNTKTSENELTEDQLIFQDNKIKDNSIFKVLKPMIGFDGINSGDMMKVHHGGTIRSYIVLFKSNPDNQQSISETNLLKFINDGYLELFRDGNGNSVQENDGEDYERQSREVEYGINPYQEQPEINNELDPSELMVGQKYIYKGTNSKTGNPVTAEVVYMKEPLDGQNTYYFHVIAPPEEKLRTPSVTLTHRGVKDCISNF